MEPLPARKAESFLNDAATRLLDTGLSRRQVAAIKHYQGAALYALTACWSESEAPVYACFCCTKSRVIRAIVSKNPSENGAEKSFRTFNILAR